MWERIIKDPNVALAATLTVESFSNVIASTSKSGPVSDIYKNKTFLNITSIVTELMKITTFKLENKRDLQ